MSSSRDSKGRFAPGHKVTRAGSPNKAKKTVEEAVAKIVEGNINQLQRDLKKLTPKDRVKAVIDLLKYTIPAKRAIDANINLESMTEDQADMILETILSKQGSDE